MLVLLSCIDQSMGVSSTGRDIDIGNNWLIVCSLDLVSIFGTGHDRPPVPKPCSRHSIPIGPESFWEGTVIPVCDEHEIIAQEEPIRRDHRACCCVSK